MKPFRNLWPAGIILAFSLFFAGTISLVVLACSHKMDLVSPDYYEQEIKYQDRIDQWHRAKDQARISYDAADCRILVQVTADTQARPVAGAIVLYRPSAAALDRRYTLAPDAQGNQSLDARNLLPGLWKVRVSWSVSGQPYFTEQSIVVGPS